MWQPLGFGDKGLSEALKRLKVEGSRPDCRCLRSAGATVAMSRPRLHAQLGFLALGVFLRLPSLQLCSLSALWGLWSLWGAPLCPHPPPSFPPAAVITPHTDLRLAHPCLLPCLSHSHSPSPSPSPSPSHPLLLNLDLDGSRSPVSSSRRLGLRHAVSSTVG